MLDNLLTKQKNIKAIILENSKEMIDLITKMTNLRTKMTDLIIKMNDLITNLKDLIEMIVLKEMIALKEMIDLKEKIDHLLMIVIDLLNQLRSLI